MTQRSEHAKSLRWAAVVAALLFVATCVVPVAAFVVPYQNNATTVSIANPIRFTSQNETGYYFNLTNVTGGMNALHITNSTSNAFGGVYNDTSSSGTFYVSDTGGRGGQDDVIIMAAINSTDPTVMGNFSMNIKAYGYNWTPTSNGKVASSTPLNYQNPSINITLDSDDFLEQPAATDVFQKWKFAPTADYPVYNGQNMGSGSELFKLMLVDTWVGTVNETVSNKSGLTDDGMTKIVYTINSPSPFDPATTKVAFNAYAYNNLTTQGQGINWLNRVYPNEGYDEDYQYSGWLVGIQP